MARQSFIVKFASEAALETFRKRVLATPEYREVAGNGARFIADFAHDVF